MASAITNRVVLPTGVVPLTLQSGTKVDENVGLGIVSYTIESTTALTLRPADFGLKEIYFILYSDDDVQSGSANILSSGNITTGNINGHFATLAVGPPVGS